MNEHYFHLTLGPVQGFVAQARRSRDYWAGSFILSWLSGVAILSVKQYRGDIHFPQPNKLFMQAMDGRRERPDHNPLQGGIPNRFKTKQLLGSVPSDFSGEKVVADIQAAWKALAQLVWENDLAPFLSTHPQYDQTQIQHIWSRQIAAIWDISWVLAEDDSQTNLLDRRKNWRSHYPSEEFGSKCMMMGSWQELSGTVNPAQPDSKTFWAELRQYLGHTDLNKGEQLCALALIKRRFAHHFHRLAVTLQSGVEIRGWSFKPLDNDHNTPLHVPSLPYLAAVPWLKNVLDCAQSDRDVQMEVDHIVVTSESAFNGRPASNIRFACFENHHHPITKIDGMTFFPHMLTSEMSYRLNDADTRADKRELENSFRHLLKSAGMQAPSPFYALLIMDGDSLGAQMSEGYKQEGISNALNQFTQQVQEIVKQHNGFLIYAGGDDVLALLPMEFALPCAIDIRETYERLFDQELAASTISAAIQYAHIKSPLMKIIADAHHLLDDIAKDQTGRDSIAIRVNKPGGVHCEWSMPWKVFLKDCDLLYTIESLSTLSENKATHGWLNRVHQLMIQLTDTTGKLIIDPPAFRALVRQEYLHSTSAQNLPKQIEDAIDKLLNMCRVVIRQHEVKPDPTEPKRSVIVEHHNLISVSETTYQPDAIKLIRFLAAKGV
ncbi:type III-B CRISPR-associated protein Cas10/Cmr2 [Vibrio sp. WXL210]|uniref:type III-B CRISPR-associated protein Cas10/Cmr2 n=1 Tax=Vibrio sp. WXL210 TaxID=3450709 RepID=UPI003EC7AB2A